MKAERDPNKYGVCSQVALKLTEGEANKFVHDIFNLIRLDDEAGAIELLTSIAVREHDHALKLVIDRFGELLLGR